MNSNIILRPYQRQLIDEVYENFREGNNRVIAWAQTGAGKGICMCQMTKEAYDMGVHVVLVMRRRALIDQTSKILDSFRIPHGVYMAKHRKFRPGELVQVCSIDTLAARELYPHEDKEKKLIIIDEKHDATPRSKKYVSLLNKYKNDCVVGFTATPFTDNSLFNAIVKPIEAHELRDQGYLVPEITFVPNVIDISGVTVKRTGEFDERELFEASSKKEIIGDFVRDWGLYSQGRPTVLFAVNVEHSKIIAEAFNEAGIRAIHCDGKTKSNERESAIRRLVRGDVSVLCNVNIFSTGVDIPEVSCIQLCRPTNSVIWHLQAIGRGLRTSPHTGKYNCVIIDNAGNTFRHGGPYLPREATLEKRGNCTPLGDELKIRACKQCHFIFEDHIRICPICSYTNPPVERKIHTADGELVEYKMTPEEIEMMNKKMLFTDFHKLCYVAKRTNGLGDWWVYKKLEEKYGVDLLSRYKDNLEIPEKLRS